MPEIEYIEQHNVGFGSCLVIGHYDNSILMIDCGSMNHKINNIPFKSVVDKISSRYQDVLQRNFLLTHYHRDHMCGFFHIIAKNPHYFKNIFLPDVVPYENKKAPLQELSLYAKIFLPRQCGQSIISTSALKIINTLSSTVGLENTFTLKSGDTFKIEKCQYKVLAPYQNHHDAFHEIIRVLYLLDSKMMQNYTTYRFSQLKEKFCKLYLKCTNSLNIQHRSVNNLEIKDLAESLFEIEKMKLNFPESQKQKIAEILTSENFSREYSFALNSTGIIFHKTSSPTILITGDAMPHMFNTMDLSPHYDIIQAPHHGTRSGFSTILNNIQKSHILISNGPYRSGGNICEKYHLDSAILHCTNNSVCPYFKSHKNCCNQLCVCNSQNTFTFKCSASSQKNSIAKCKIYSLDLDTSCGCYCL